MNMDQNPDSRVRVVNVTEEIIYLRARPRASQTDLVKALVKALDVSDVNNQASLI